MVRNIKNLKDEQIFAYYFKVVPQLGRLYKSPFRNDKNPTGSFFITNKGTLLFHDFGTGINYSARKTVELKERVPYSKIDSILLKNYDVIKNIEVTELKEERAFNLNISLGEEDFTYFYEYGIKKSILDKWKVKCIKSVYINNELRYRSTSKNPIFGYFFNSGNVKLYRPLSPVKENKWGGNSTINDVGGLTDLKVCGRVVIITSSIKDAMVIESLGFPAICFNSEVVSPDNEIVGLVIKALKIRFENVILFFDSDQTGRDNSIKLKTKFKIKEIFVDKEKDISDYIKRYKKRKSSEKLKKLIASCA